MYYTIHELSVFLFIHLGTCRSQLTHVLSTIFISHVAVEPCDWLLLRASIHKLNNKLILDWLNL